MLTKHLTKKTSAVSESAEIHVDTSRQGTTKMSPTVTEAATEDTGLAFGTTDHTEVTRFQSVGPAEKSVATYVSQYVPLLACSLGIVIW